MDLNDWDVVKSLLVAENLSLQKATNKEEQTPSMWKSLLCMQEKRTKKMQNKAHCKI